MRIIRHLGLLALSVVLAACGGGGREEPVTPGAAQGFYIGNTSPDFETMTLTLENDQYWSILGHTDGSTFYTHVLIQGTGVSRSGSYFASNLRDFDAISFGDISLRASYQPGVSFSGTFNHSSGSENFATNVPIASLYNYNTPANFSNITGSWLMTDLGDELGNHSNHTITVNITSGGTLTGSSAEGCGITGTLAQRPSSRNVFNVTMQFNSRCVPASETVNGIAVEYLLPGGTQRRLMIAGVNSFRNDAAVLVGTR